MLIVIKEVFFIMLTTKNLEKMQMFLVRRDAVFQVKYIRKAPTLWNIEASSVDSLPFYKISVTRNKHKEKCTFLTRNQTNDLSARVSEMNVEKGHDEFV